MVEFTWKKITFLVKMSSGATVYRDKAHLGGPWSQVVDTLKNSSFDLSFRRALAKAEKEVLAKL
jgi:hypothetical protein